MERKNHKNTRNEQFFDSVIEKTSQLSKIMSNKIFTIGHSTKTIGQFIDKIKLFGITVLVDVRSIPHSRWTPQFNRNILSNSLKNAGIKYLYRGNNLGGIKENTLIDETLNELVELSKSEKIVLMCAEKDYRKCHRYLKIAPALTRLSADVENIIWDTDSQQNIPLF